MESTGVELAGNAKLVAPMEKATTGLVGRLCRVHTLWKAVVGGRLSGEGGRRATTFWHCGDAGRRGGGVVESAVARWRGGAWSQSTIVVLL